MDKHHLALCHCKTIHNELFLYKSDGTKESFRSDGLKDRIEYIDSSCKDDSNQWSDITSNSKDYIWSIYCPVYGLLKRGNIRELEDGNALKDILVNGWNVLKQNGKIILTISNDDEPDKMLERLKEFNKVNGNNNWDINIVSVDTLPFVVNYKSPKYKQYFVLTKNTAGGKRRKTIRHKRIRNGTRIHSIR